MRFKPLDHACVLTLLGYAASTVVTPICLVILAKELAFGLAAGGGVEAMRTFLMLVVVFFSGFAAARWGKPRVIAFSLIAMGGGLFLYAASVNYLMLFAAMGLLGMGSGGADGLVNPLIQDLHPRDSGRYLNIINGFWSVGVLVTVLLVGELLTRGCSWRLIAAAMGLFCLAVGLLFLRLERTEPPHAPRPQEDARRHIREVLVLPRFWRLAVAIFFAAAVEAAFTFWSASYIQIQFQTLPRAGGIGTACFAAGMVLGRFHLGRFIQQRHLRRAILLASAGGVLVSLAVPFVQDLAIPGVQNLHAFYAMLLLAGLAVAPLWPSLQSHSADCLPQTDHTMLFILLSCLGIAGFGLTSWVMGMIAQQVSLQASFFVIPGLFLGLAAAMAVDRFVEKRAAPGRPSSLSNQSDHFDNPIFPRKVKP